MCQSHTFTHDSQLSFVNLKSAKTLSSDMLASLASSKHSWFNCICSEDVLKSSALNPGAQAFGGNRVIADDIKVTYGYNEEGDLIQ